MGSSCEHSVSLKWIQMCREVGWIKEVRNGWDSPTAQHGEQGLEEVMHGRRQPQLARCVAHTFNPSTQEEL